MRPIHWALLDALQPHLAKEVVSAARHRKFGKGEALFVEGDPAEVVHLIGRGHIGIQVTTPLGEVAMLRVLGPGDHVGEMAILTSGKRSATAMALEATETLEIHRDQIGRLRDRNPGVDRAFLEVVVQEVRRLSTQVLEITYVPVPARLARRLVELAATYPSGSSGRVTIPLTQEDLAGLCGTTRPTTNQLLRKLQDEGGVEMARGKTIVTDLRVLQRWAG